MNDLLDAIAKEISLRKDYLKKTGEKPLLKTIYFGGGTPSLLNADQLNTIFKAINNYYQIADDAEITLEANPDDLTPEKLSELKQTPVNRLSIGIQSFFEDDLKLMNRAHNADMAKQCVFDSAAAGFKNITIDLIYGLPDMNEDKWNANLDIAFSMPVNHLSCYSLTVEKKTALDKMIRDGKIKGLNSDHAANHFLILMNRARQNGFEHYEISNFAKPGFHSKHNSSYWKNESYIGIGPSAHSYNGISRQWNISSNSAYINSINDNKLPFEEELLTKENRYNEYVMTGLRTIWGVDLNYVKNNFGNEFVQHFTEQINRYTLSGDVLVFENKYILNDHGKLLADRIAADAFYV